MKQKFKLDLVANREPLVGILQEILDSPTLSPKLLNNLQRRYPRPEGGLYSRAHLIEAYRAFAGTHGLPPYEEAVIERLRRKPTRTVSGVTPVTVLTKPFPCPGECIFCPSDLRMPKSYLLGEPGAQRAEQNAFDPYLQTYTRLLSLRAIGHPTAKIEMIILGGTWSFYPENYQIWFIKRVFDALHDFSKEIDLRQEVWDALRDSTFHPDNDAAVDTVQGVNLSRTYNQLVQDIYSEETRRSSEMAQAVARGERERSPVDEYATWEELEAAHRENETSACRNVGLVVETRPDHISVEEVLRIRRLGGTKVQIGFQSLNDEVLRLNKRGHDVAATHRAVNLLRRVGFKIHAHWMPNLYGSSPDADISDYSAMFDDPDLRPDELKVYPCSLIESAELMQNYENGSWKPYTHDELLYVLTECFKRTPEYCRLTRVIRDIPSTDILTGNQMTNFRQLVDVEMERQGARSGDIRSREVRHRQISADELHLDEVRYTSGIGNEIFLQYITEERDITAFLRLSLPNTPALTDEVDDAAIIREVHVYGQALDIGESSPGRAQHVGLGTQLIERAAEIAKEQGYKRLAVISAVGTREYYRKRGFADGALYQIRNLT